MEVAKLKGEKDKYEQEIRVIGKRIERMRAEIRGNAGRAGGEEQESAALRSEAE